jgi:T-complex protein 10 C-terminus
MGFRQPRDSARREHDPYGPSSADADYTVSACYNPFARSSCQLSPRPMLRKTLAAMLASLQRLAIIASLGAAGRQDTVHMDGKRERLFRNGRRMVVFVNGTIKEEYPSGLSIVRFTNGDIKKAYTSGVWLCSFLMALPARCRPYR